MENEYIHLNENEDGSFSYEFKKNGERGYSTYPQTTSPSLPQTPSTILIDATYLIQPQGGQENGNGRSSSLSAMGDILNMSERALIISLAESVMTGELSTQEAQNIYNYYKEIKVRVAQLEELKRQELFRALNEDEAKANEENKLEDGDDVKIVVKRKNRW